jgi:hypothetical protein
MEKRGYMSFLGEAMWFLISKYIYKPIFGLGGGSLVVIHSLLHLSHSSFLGASLLIHSYSLVLSMDMNGCMRVAWGEVRASFFPWCVLFPFYSFLFTHYC